MTTSMPALVWHGPESLRLEEVPQPTAGPQEVVIRVSHAGICGSELEGYLGRSAIRVPPLVMGHEFAGSIQALGADAGTHLQLGDQVTVNPLSNCGRCHYCTEGLQHLCGDRQLVGAHRPGAFARSVAVPASSVVKLPAGVDPAVGALCEPAAVATRVAVLARLRKGDPVLVIGAGPIGLLCLQALQQEGAGEIYICDTNPARSDMAAALGGIAVAPGQALARELTDRCDGLGVAVAVDAVGSTVTRRACIEATRSGGRIILSGLHDEQLSASAGELIRRELTLQGAYSYRPVDFAAALQRLAEGQMHLRGCTVEAELAAGSEWFPRLLAGTATVAKVLLRPPG